MTVRLLMFVLLWLVALPALAQDALYRKIEQGRGNYGRVVHIFGDSIARGYALKQFGDQVPDTHPLYVFRSIGATANAALRDNGRTEVVAWAGPMDLPDTPARMDDLVRSGVIRSDDVVVLEDAGRVPGDLDAYRVWLENLRFIAGRYGARVVLMTMFDYAADPNYQWAEANPYIIAAATADLDVPGQPILIHMAAFMDSWRWSADMADGMPVMLADGIHPNIWGQTMMVREILKAAGLLVHIKTLRTLKAIAATGALNYNVPGFTNARAKQYLDYLLKPR